MTSTKKPDLGRALKFAEGAENTSRLTVNLPRDLHRKFKILAASQDKTMGQMVEAWIRREVE